MARTTSSGNQRARGRSRQRGSRPSSIRVSSVRASPACVSPVSSWNSSPPPPASNQRYVIYLYYILYITNIYSHGLRRRASENLLRLVLSEDIRNMLGIYY